MGISGVSARNLGWQGPPRTAPGPEALPGEGSHFPFLLLYLLQSQAQEHCSFPSATPGKREQPLETEIQAISRGHDPGMMARGEREGGPPIWWQNRYISSSQVPTRLYFHSQYPATVARAFGLSTHQLLWLCILNLL